MKKVFFVLTLLVFVAGCKDEDVSPCTAGVSDEKIAAVDQAQLQKDITAIDAYLTSKSIVAIKDVSGLRYVISTVGDDSKPCLESQVKVNYTGKLLTTGVIFDSSKGTAVTFPLSNLILGWQIGFPNFGKGTKATLYIPSVFAYGKNAAGSIPANSNLIFDIELISF
jgi:FKBP-type peptidyl-prolyl cis-trans isomerase FkpA